LFERVHHAHCVFNFTIEPVSVADYLILNIQGFELGDQFDTALDIKKAVPVVFETADVTDQQKHRDAVAHTDGQNIVARHVNSGSLHVACDNPSAQGGGMGYGRFPLPNVAKGILTVNTAPPSLPCAAVIVPFISRT